MWRNWFIKKRNQKQKKKQKVLGATKIWASKNLSRQVLFVFDFLFFIELIPSHVFTGILFIYSFLRKINCRDEIFTLKALNLVQQSYTYLAIYDLIWQLFVRIDKSNYVMYLSDFLYPSSGVFGPIWLLFAKR